MVFIDDTWSLLGIDTSLIYEEKNDVIGSDNYVLVGFNVLIFD